MIQEDLQSVSDTSNSETTNCCHDDEHRDLNSIDYDKGDSVRIPNGLKENTIAAVDLGRDPHLGGSEKRMKTTVCFLKLVLGGLAR
jgi:hypothetical protein